MIKYFIINRQKLNALLYSILCISFLPFFSSCGDTYHSSTDTGSIAFSVEWRGAQTKQHNEEGFRALDCAATGVVSVEAHIFDENGSYLTAGGPWLCSAHAGTIENVPEGLNRKVVVSGKDSNDNLLYSGEITGITVTADQTTNAGTIVVEPVNNTAPTAPTGVNTTAGDGQVTISWNSVSGANSYKIYWATWSGVSKIDYEDTHSPETSANPDTTVFESVLSYNGHTYAVTKDSMTWEEANTLSDQHGGYLVTINDAQENSFLIQNYLSFLSELWIGYNDKDNEGTWVWANGETSTYTNWDVVEPNGAEYENCACIYPTGKWNDLPCANLVFAIVEWEPVAATSYTHTGLTNDTTYYYVVTAVNDYGESGGSSEVNATPGTSQPPTEGLVAYYPFNGNANDESGNGNHGTVKGATLTTDRFGNANSAYNFDGVDDWISLGDPSILQITSDLTITAWIFLEQGEVTNHIFSRRSTNCGAIGYQIGHETNGLYFSSGNNVAVPSNISVSENQWVFIAVVFNDALNTVDFYVDNQKLLGQDVVDLGNPANADIQIGQANGCSLSTLFDGVIDDIRVYNHTLSETEIHALYNLSKLPDTGQTTSYTTTFGEDSDYTINPPSYTDNGNGTITDNVTSLIWQKEDDNTRRIWDDAVSYCNNLTFAEYSDWHLPVKKELMSIVDYGTYSPSIDTTYFTGTNTLDYWSSTSRPSSPGAWTVAFDRGNIYGANKSLDYYVRCVRGRELSFGNFIDNGNGTVTDNSTGLMWQQDEGGSKTWEDAIMYCEGLSSAGYADWRLPNIKELASITDDNISNPAIDTNFFFDANASGYWSSTTDTDYYSSSFAWCVDFNSGFVISINYVKSESHYVRCVRGGQ